MLKIITCIKQVPASSQVEVDPKTGVLIRDGNNVKMNPYDLYALEASFTVKEMKENVSVHAITMGPPSASSVLSEALYMGADDASLITDRRFAGADVLATSYTLSQLIRHIKDYDIIVCGKQTTDGDTAQVGPEIAEFLGIPHVPYIKKIVEVKEDSIVVISGYDLYDEKIEVKFPCLITVEKDSYVPRLPSFRRKETFKGYQIPMISLKHLEDQDPEHYGLSGSPTQVEEIFPPNKKMESKLLEGTSKDLSKAMFDILKESKYV